MICYKEVNLPTIPAELLVFNKEPDKFVKDIGYGLEHFKDGRKLNACAYINTAIRDNPLRTWIENNIPGVNNDSKVLLQRSKAFDAESTHIVHLDIGRVFALNYFLDLGGDNVLTSWYQEKNMPVHRVKTERGKQADTGQVKYDDLTVLATTKFELHKWYLLSTDMLHDVDHITGNRASITVSFNDRSILEKLGIQDV